MEHTAGTRVVVLTFSIGSSRVTDAHLNARADFWAANHDAWHYSNLVAYLRFNGRVPSGGGF